MSILHRKTRRAGKQGFTLIEMLVVIAIIGILSAAVLVSLGPARDKAKDARIISGIEQARLFMETKYDTTINEYPSSITGLDEWTALEKSIGDTNGDAVAISVGGGAWDSSYVKVCATLVSDSTRKFCAGTDGQSGTE